MHPMNQVHPLIQNGLNEVGYSPSMTVVVEDITSVIANSSTAFKIGPYTEVGVEYWTNLDVCGVKVKYHHASSRNEYKPWLSL